MTSQTVIYNKLNYFLRRVWAFAMTTCSLPTDCTDHGWNNESGLWDFEYSHLPYR